MTLNDLYLNAFSGTLINSTRNHSTNDIVIFGGLLTQREARA